ILLDGHGEPLVSDFGLATWLDTPSDLTHTLTIFGTPGYIAPEQANGSVAKLTPAADVYSLGAILFNLFTGRPPFLGEHALAIIQQAATKPAPKLRSLEPTLDRDLETICAKCLEREPKTRYLSAGDLAEDLERWLEGLHIIARPVSPPARVWRWSRRNPVVAGMAALLLILGTAVGALIWKGQFATPPVASGIAVLPFENLSAEDESAFFADSVQDGILTKLARVADLKVISRTSVLPYRGARSAQQIAQALNVSHVLEGSVRRNAGKIFLNVRLIDARTDTHVWAEKYECDVNELFTIQSRITQKVAAQLHARVSAVEEAAIKEPPTTDLVAYDRYSRAKGLVNGIAFSTRGKEDLFRPCNCLTRPSRATLCFLMLIASSRERMTGCISLASIIQRRALNCPKRSCNRSAACAPTPDKRVWPSLSIFIGRIRITTEPGWNWMLPAPRCQTNPKLLLWPVTLIGARVSG